MRIELCGGQIKRKLRNDFEKPGVNKRKKGVRWNIAFNLFSFLLLRVPLISFKTLHGG